jgi:hypothetical protein
MRWVQTANGERAHAVASGTNRTLCGISLKYVGAIVSPGPDDRCGNCDKRWREIGRAQKKHVNRPRRRDVYHPRNKVRWE